MIRKHNSKQDEVAFLHDFFLVVENTDRNMDVSIVLDSEHARYLYELIGCSEKLSMPMSDNDNDFGDFTGNCLLTIFKDGNEVEVIVEDISFINNNDEIELKYHEAGTVMILENQLNNVKLSQLLNLYEVEKAIVISFETDEKIDIKALLF